MMSSKPPLPPPVAFETDNGAGGKAAAAAPIENNGAMAVEASPAAAEGCGKYEENSSDFGEVADKLGYLGGRPGPGPVPVRFPGNGQGTSDKTNNIRNVLAAYLVLDHSYTVRLVLLLTPEMAFSPRSIGINFLPLHRLHRNRQSLASFLPFQRAFSPYILKDSKGSLGNETVRVFEITDAAAEQLNKLRDKFPDKNLRIAVEAGGCHGFQYKFLLDSSDSLDSENDILFEYRDPKVSNEISLICDSVSWNIINRARLDYIRELIGASFQILDNPAAASGCGCGISFDLKQ